MIRRKLMGSLVPAFLGVAAGLAYARFTLPEALLHGSSFPALYASVGAISGILLVRLTALVRSMLEEFRRRRS